MVCMHGCAKTPATRTPARKINKYIYIYVLSSQWLSLVKLRKWALNFKSIYIHCLGSLRRWAAPKVAREPSLTFDCTCWLSIHSSHLLSGTFPSTLYWALSQCLVDMLLQHCPGHICHLDSSRAAWHSPWLPTARSELRQNWKSLEVTSQVY